MQNEKIPAQITEKIKRFCAYRERCIEETKKKIKSLGANAEQSEKIIQLLTNEGYIDERRFAGVFVRGKFNNNHWGRVKIQLELNMRNIPDAVSREALKEIDDEAYAQLLSKLAGNKMRSLMEKSADDVREKTAAYCIGKGFEPDLVWQTINVPVK